MAERLRVAKKVRSDLRLRRKSDPNARIHVVVRTPHGSEERDFPDLSFKEDDHFARLVDFIPDVVKGTNAQFARLSVQGSEGTLSDVYSRVLRMSQVMHEELPEATKAKIEKFRNLLTTRIKKTNLATDEVTEVLEPSEMMKAFLAKSQARTAAMDKYNNARIAAMTAADSQAVHAWALNGAASAMRSRPRTPTG